MAQTNKEQLEELIKEIETFLESAAQQQHHLDQQQHQLNEAKQKAEARLEVLKEVTESM